MNSGLSKTEVGGIEVVCFDDAVFQMAHAIDARGVEFVETVRAVNDEGGFGTEFIEDVRERLSEVGRINARELDVGARGVGERTKDVEDGALTKLLARTDGMFHGGMKFSGEHKADANLFDGLGNLLRRKFEADTERREDIRRTAMR